MTRHAKYDGRCGMCKYFSFYVKNGEIREQGRCNNQKRVNYHQASQKACKLYKAERSERMKLVNWQYCNDPNDINEAIKTKDEDWEGLTSANDIISITYDPNHGCYVIFWRSEE